ncbi:unnamed protein product [Pleuronectes platessa]|uniref:Uncharacterized protein n=1 Tax=Pleuronectes platessa TaxID=8262 RepID=A0A9N7YKW0_PLEPL|nr:unnamed protein product [Pleuronectes platessa]
MTRTRDQRPLLQSQRGAGTKRSPEESLAFFIKLHLPLGDELHRMVPVEHIKPAFPPGKAQRGVRAPASSGSSLSGAMLAEFPLWIPGQISPPPPALWALKNVIGWDWEMGLEASRDQAPEEECTSERNKQEHRGKENTPCYQRGGEEEEEEEEAL